MIFILSLGCATGAVQRHPRAALTIWAAPPKQLRCRPEASISHGLPDVCFMHLIAAPARLLQYCPL